MDNSRPLLARYWYEIIIVFAIPLFFVGFTSLYDPLGIQQYLTFANTDFQFNVVILYCILVGVLLLSRTGLWLINRNVTFLWWHHMLWCFGEMYVASYFLALYVTLAGGNSIPYITSLGKCLGFLYLTLPYPYSIFVLIHIINWYDIKIRTERPAPAGPRMDRFYDENGKLKLTVERNSVLYVEAEFNYVNIHYLEGDKQKNFVLRNTMKGIERNSDTLGLVRCHRSFFVNPIHVKSLSRDRDGQIYASTDGLDQRAVPVSRNYYNSLSSIL